jgi:predicted RNA binding protein with dsRBD fold (UPF0201 family)
LASPLGAFNFDVESIMDESHVSADIDILVAAIKSGGEELSAEDAKYSHSIKFGKLYQDTVDTLEALNGTLRAAKKQKVVDFKKQMLLKGPDDNEVVYLCKS